MGRNGNHIEMGLHAFFGCFYWDQNVVFETPALPCRSPNSGEFRYKYRGSKLVI